MGSFQTQSGLQQGDQLLEVSSILIEIDQFFQLICVHNNVQTAHLGQPEFLRLNAGEADLNESGNLQEVIFRQTANKQRYYARNLVVASPF